jgi:hypothetical protein
MNVETLNNDELMKEFVRVAVFIGSGKNLRENPGLFEKDLELYGALYVEIKNRMDSDNE